MGGKSHYLKQGRLEDVISAITTMGTYKFYKLEIEEWANRISGKASEAERWRAVIVEHPEFFRVARDSSEGVDANSKQKASLVWRRQFSKIYHVDQKEELQLARDQKYAEGDRLSRRPLEPSELTALMNVAVNLHDNALKHAENNRWWIPILVGLLGFLGAVAGGWAGAHTDFVGIFDGTQEEHVSEISE